jgi:hypothetical protein
MKNLTHDNIKNRELNFRLEITELLQLTDQLEDKTRNLSERMILFYDKVEKEFHRAYYDKEFMDEFFQSKILTDHLRNLIIVDKIYQLESFKKELINLL